MGSWQDSIVDSNSSIRDATEAIARSGMQIALVADADRKLQGIITDVDVRRAVLENMDFSSNVETLMKKTPVVARVDQSKQEIREIMSIKRVHQVPIVDYEGCVCGIASYYDFADKAKHDNAVILMAGGYGTRLRPLTENIPKPMLEVGSKPILETIIDSFTEKGFYRFYLTVNYKADIIENYFGDGCDKGVEIKYIREEEKLGTAGAIAMLPDVLNEPFIVMNGDILTKLDYISLMDYHIAEEAVATMAVREYTSRIPYGVIGTDSNRIVKITEKPEETCLVNAGIYVMSPEVVNEIERGRRLDMPQLFEKMIKQNMKTIVYPVRNYWIDIGRMEDFEKAKLEYDSIW